MSFNLATPGLKMLIHTSFKYCWGFRRSTYHSARCPATNTTCHQAILFQRVVASHGIYDTSSSFQAPISPSLHGLMPTKQQWRPLKEGMSMMCLATANIFRKSRAWATAGLLFVSSVLAKQCAGSFSQHSAQIFRCQRNLFGHDQVL